MSCGEQVLSVTIAVSCYNQEAYISECLLSILNQITNFKFDIVISDDNSSDRSVDVIRSLMDVYPDKISLNVNDTNMGAANNYLLLHGMVNSDIIFHFDGDDIMLPGKLQKQYDVFASDDDVNIVFHRANYFNDSRTYQSVTGFIGEDDSDIFYFDSSNLSLWGTIAVHGSYAYRRSSRSYTILNREFMEWFWAMDSLLVSGKGAYINDVLIDYRCNEGGSAYSRTRKGRIKAYDIYVEDLLFYFKNSVHKKELYTNALVSFLGMLRYNKYFNRKLFLFILCNLPLLNLKNLANCLRVRRSVAPRARS